MTGGGGGGAAGSGLSGAIAAQPTKANARPNTIKTKPVLTPFCIRLIMGSIGNFILHRFYKCNLRRVTNAIRKTARQSENPASLGKGTCDLVDHAKRSLNRRFPGVLK
jgi:hypothetical protein